MYGFISFYRYVWTNMKPFRYASPCSSRAVNQYSVCSFSSSCFGSVIMCSETINFPYKSVHNKHLSTFLAYTITPVCVQNICTSRTTHTDDALRLCASIAWKTNFIAGSHRTQTIRKCAQSLLEKACKYNTHTYMLYYYKGKMWARWCMP